MKKRISRKISVVLFTVRFLVLASAIIGAGVWIYFSALQVGAPAESLSVVPTPDQHYAPSGFLSTKILMYHRIRVPAVGDYYSVSPDVFRDQMLWLRDHGYSVVSYHDLIVALTSTGTLPLKSVVLTFDDGYRSQFRSAFPVLKELGYSAIFYPYTRDLGRADFLTEDMIRELYAHGMTIGSHTVTHRRLDRLSDSELAYEVEQSKLKLENIIQAQVSDFCYPFGLYNDAAVRAVRAAGYATAVSVRQTGQIDKSEGLYFLPRYPVANSVESLISVLKK